MDPEKQYLLGQPTSESLKELYQNAEKAPTGFELLASNPELYSNKRIMEAGEMRGHEMHFKHQRMLHATRCRELRRFTTQRRNNLNQFDAIFLEFGLVLPFMVVL
jgi:ribosomal protein S6--L-glutamate ligase